MAEVHIEHIFNCSEDTFWDKVFWDDGYNDRMFSEALKFPVHDRVRQDDKGDTIERVIDVVPKLGDMPAALKKVIGEGVGYREDGVFDKKTRHFKVKITPNKLSDKMTITGEFFTEPAGDGKCKRVFNCTAVAKIFGVGGMLEKRIMADMQQSYDTAAKFTNQYLKEKELEGK